MADILNNLIITQVFSATTMYSDTNTSSRRINRQRWAIIIKYEGETVYCAYGKEYISNRTHLAILPKGSSYQWTCKQAGHYAVVEFDSLVTCEDFFTFSISDCDAVLSIFRELEAKRMLNRSSNEIESIYAVYGMILKILELSRKPAVPFRKVDKLAPALAYISDHYTEDLNNDQLAKAAGLSTVYFRKLFKEVYQVSPMNYVKEIRIEKAKEMLRSDFGNISEVGLSLGYPSIYDFSRDFKKHVGLSPRKFILQYHAAE